MTAIPTAPLTEETVALLCAKIAQANDVSWNSHTGELAPEDVLLPLMERGLIIEVDSWRGGSQVSLTETGRAAAASANAQALYGPATQGADRAQAALWLWLLLNGSVNGGYDSYYDYGRDGEIAHLLLCGLDPTESGKVRDDVWTTWGGTFADGDRVTGVGGYATCRCEEVERLHITHKVESVTALIEATLQY